MADQDPRQSAPDIPPPSSILHKDAGMASQGDMTDAPADEHLERHRRDTINPSLPRDPGNDEAASKQPELEAGSPKDQGQKDPAGHESSLDHSNMNPDNLGLNDR